MKKKFPYIIIFFVLTAIIVMITVVKNEKNRSLDERISFRKQDKIPYGAFVAFKSLKFLFPQAVIYTSKQEPGYWDSLSGNEPGQALIIVAPNFHADEYEMKKILMFVESGNDVFVSARNISIDVEKVLNCRTSIFGLSSLFREQGKIADDSLVVSLFHPPYHEYSSYSYPGFNLNAWAYETDSTITDKLGGDELNRVNFIHLKAGQGNFYLHLAPLAFSNYFLLHRNNMAYYQKVMSVISPDVKKVVWDEYFLKKRDRNNQNRASWFNVLFRFPALKAALLTAIFVLLLYVLMEMRRKQRIIPVLIKPRNDSFEFVKTIGRLYHDKGDHKNLCRKMSSYFLEHIRTRYKLLTNKLDEGFIENLHFKSGYPKEEITKIVSYISYLEEINSVSDKQLIAYHKQLELFYQNT